MDWERVRNQLGIVLQAPIQMEKVPQQQWHAWIQSQTPAGDKAVKSVNERGQIYFLLENIGSHMQVFAVEEVLLTTAERQLVELMLEAYRTQEKPRTTILGEEERKANLVKDWFYRQLETGDPYAEMPDALATQLSMYALKVPLLLYGDYSDNRNVQYHELKKLLDSFFDAEIVLIPLMDKEWLILGTEHLLSESSEERDADGEESLEDSLASICSGLYDMLANEWVGECHLSIHYPIVPAKSLMGTILHMRETMALGRTYELGSNIHLPWKLYLEKLLLTIPEAEKQRFVEKVLKHVDRMLDAETQSTLEQFFALDCNVSETAKKLYIHRNTLLYRLDKFKQETGLDVRNFTDAVLVKVAMLLYKVTKRK